ncbi:hypothetical protein [Kitasatospora sp. NPDC093679]|uniref:hypothetical protein n=1 Tax=Kitasatospora sp. NPDC093679 TaxID=3154983 RepID=UPI00342B3021
MEHSSEFFRPGRTYVAGSPFTAPETAVIFRCVAVAEHPGKKEPRALGFAATVYPLRWASVAFDAGNWQVGWMDMGPTVEGEDDQERPANPAEPTGAAAQKKGEDVIARGTLVTYRGSLSKLHGKYRAEQCGCRRCAGVMDGPRYLLRDRVTDEVAVRCARRRSVSPVF